MAPGNTLSHTQAATRAPNVRPRGPRVSLPPCACLPGHSEHLAAEALIQPSDILGLEACFGVEGFPVELGRQPLGVEGVLWRAVFGFKGI